MGVRVRVGVGGLEEGVRGFFWESKTGWVELGFDG